MTANSQSDTPQRTVPSERIVACIPSRYASSRFPGKPLAKILGRPMLEWVVRGAQQADFFDEVIVATDHDEIAALGRSLGVRVVMTDPDLPSGTDRVYQAVKDTGATIVFNVQGDEPLIQGSVLRALRDAFLDQTVRMATLAEELPAEDWDQINVAKIAMDENKNALLFSRYPLGGSRHRDNSWLTSGALLKHIGIYAYRFDFLRDFCAHAPVAIELGEGLEQLRALVMGEKIRVVQVPFQALGVDTPQDVSRAEARLKERA